ncbi:MAG: hypothetical protein ACRDF4_04330, partial [Rhabdochlamydiaceae bacterium]
MWKLTDIQSKTPLLPHGSLEPAVLIPPGFDELVFPGIPDEPIPIIPAVEHAIHRARLGKKLPRIRGPWNNVRHIDLLHHFVKIIRIDDLEIFIGEKDGYD